MLARSTAAYHQRTAGAVDRFERCLSCLNVTIYLEVLRQRLYKRRVQRIALKNPFLLRTAHPALDACAGRNVGELRRLGKRIATGLEGDLWLLLHLMIAGGLHWYGREHRGRRHAALLYLQFESGTLTYG